jgi:hypothetical protein
MLEHENGIWVQTGPFRAELIARNVDGSTEGHDPRRLPRALLVEQAYGARLRATDGSNEQMFGLKEQIPRGGPSD